MPTSTFTRFNDPYTYQSMIRAAAVDLVVTGRGEFRSELIRIDLHHLWMQRGYENLPRIAHCHETRERSAIFLLAHQDEREICFSGRGFASGEILVHKPGEENYHRTSAPCRWAAMSLAPEDLAAAGRHLAGRELHAPCDAYITRPTQESFVRLRSLHNAAGLLAGKYPNILTHPETARALENALVHAMVTCLTEHAPVPDTFGSRCHLTVIARFARLLDAEPKKPLYLAEICAATGVSERTLRLCCHEHLGMGPVRYLWLRRMHLARAALMKGDPKTTSVTTAAVDHGFWELGRFAVAYRSLFGESPSATLKRVSAAPPASHDSPFALGSAVSA
jgi:AraC-like DNA-binding protein